MGKMDDIIEKLKAEGKEMEDEAINSLKTTHNKMWLAYD